MPNARAKRTSFIQQNMHLIAPAGVCSSYPGPVHRRGPSGGKNLFGPGERIYSNRRSTMRRHVLISALMILGAVGCSSAGGENSQRVEAVDAQEGGEEISA